MDESNKGKFGNFSEAYIFVAVQKQMTQKRLINKNQKATSSAHYTTWLNVTWLLIALLMNVHLLSDDKTNMPSVNNKMVWIFGALILDDLQLKKKWEHSVSSDRLRWT